MDSIFTFNRVTFIGFGLINSSLARVFKSKSLAKEICAYSRRKETLLKIKDLNIADYIYDDVEKSIENSDLIIALGTRLSIPQTGYKTKLFAQNAKKIIVDIDKYELNKKKFSKVVAKINIDLKIFLKQAVIYFKNKKIKKFNVDYMSQGYVDSLGFIKFVSSIEKFFNIKFNQKDFMNRNFRTINGLAQIISVRKKK